MSTDASDAMLAIEYEAAAATAGGPDAADFQIRRTGHATLEVALYLALDARQAFEQRCGPLSDGDVQAVIRAIADGLYTAQIQSGIEPAAIQTVRARDLSEDLIDSAIGAAGLSRLPAGE